MLGTCLQVGNQLESCGNSVSVEEMSSSDWPIGKSVGHFPD